MSDENPDALTLYLRLVGELLWLREGLLVALQYLQDDRKTLAINTLKGTLAGRERCW